MTSATFFDRDDHDADPLLDDLKAMLRQHAMAHPRQKQMELGPSEVGHPCSRRLAASMMGRDPVNPSYDVLASYIGTAAHKQMEDAVKMDNERIRNLMLKDLGPKAFWQLDPRKIENPRWISERRVKVREGLSGTCDLYDTHTNSVIDFKFPGPTAMTGYRRKGGPSEVYRTQVHLYGKGYRNLGYDVKRVGIWFLPRGGQLAGSILWHEPYSEQRVSDTLKRLDDIVVTIDGLDLEHHPERYAYIPINPEQCQYCPYFTVNPNHPDPCACHGGGYNPTHSSAGAPPTGGE
jgi:hypothetical protein